MKISNKDIRKLVMERIKKVVLNEEITTVDAFNKFYDGKLPKDIFDALTIGTTNMTPYHRKIVDAAISCVNNYGTNGEATNSLIKCSVAAWNSGENARQFLINTATENYPIYSSNVYDLIDFLRNVVRAKKYSENEFNTNALETIYEDDDLLVTCTLSYTASHKNYADSHWCTASGIDGRWNGFDMFHSYSEPSDDDEEPEGEYDEFAIPGNNLLIQFVDKHDRKKSFQMATNGREGIGSVCDYMDEPSNINDIKDHFGADKVDKVLEIIWEKYREFGLRSGEFVAGEGNYYRFSNYTYVAHNADKIRQKKNTPAYIDAIMDAINLNAQFNFNKQASPSFIVYPVSSAELEEDNFTYTPFDIRIRTSNEDYDPEEENVKYGFFNDTERSVIARSRNLPYDNFEDLSRETVLARLDCDGHWTFIGKYGCVLVDTIANNVLEINGKENGSWVYKYLDIKTGRVVFSYKEGKLEYLQYDFDDREDEIMYFGKSEGKNFTIFFELNTIDCRLKKVNRAFVLDTNSWYYSNYKEVKPTEA